MSYAITMKFVAHASIPNRAPIMQLHMAEVTVMCQIYDGWHCLLGYGWHCLLGDGWHCLLGYDNWWLNGGGLNWIINDCNLWLWLKRMNYL